MSKIAIFQGMDRHFEMLGYLFDFCYSYNLEFTLFSPTFMDWEDYYNKIFDKKIDWNNPEFFSPDNFNYIFLVTDDDPFFKDEWLENNSDKIICIDHWTGHIRRNNVLVHVNTRYATKYNNIFWALPTYPVIKSVEEKLTFTNIHHRINIVCIGYNSTPKSSENLKTIFTNFDDINFHIINHYIHYKYDDVSNIKEYINASVETMTNLLKNADYVLCLQNNNTKDYVNDIMSAAIPMAFNFGCQLIIPTSWNNSYKFMSPIVYEYNCTKINAVKLSNPEQILKERNLIINYRNAVFKGIMKL